MLYLATYLFIILVAVIAIIDIVGYRARSKLVYRKPGTTKLVYKRPNHSYKRLYTSGVLVVVLALTTSACCARTVSGRYYHGPARTTATYPIAGQSTDRSLTKLPSTPSALTHTRTYNDIKSRLHD